MVFTFSCSVHAASVSCVPCAQFIKILIISVWMKTGVLELKTLNLRYRSLNLCSGKCVEFCSELTDQGVHLDISSTPQGKNRTFQVCFTFEIIFTENRLILENISNLSRLNNKLFVVKNKSGEKSPLSIYNFKLNKKSMFCWLETPPTL